MAKPEWIKQYWNQYTTPNLPFLRFGKVATAGIGAVVLAWASGIADIIETAWETILIDPVSAFAAWLGSLVQIMTLGDVEVMSLGEIRATADESMTVLRQLGPDEFLVTSNGVVTPLADAAQDVVAFVETLGVLGYVAAFAFTLATGWVAAQGVSYVR